MQQGQMVSENIVRSIQGRPQISYQQQWWEGLTKITVGLVSDLKPSSDQFLTERQGKSVAYVSDGQSELTMTLGQKTELDSAAVWKHLGATPFQDE